jgi:glycosyltransferase involved in cell wall biosynthesis
MISIVIPTFNGHLSILNLLKSISSQKDGVKKEIIIIDSSSTDDTTKIISKYSKNILIHVIPKNEFSHGKTRNLGIKISSKESRYIFFTTQDSILSSNKMFAHYLDDFNKYPKTVAAFGPHLPHNNSSIFSQIEITSLFQQLHNQYQNKQIHIQDKNSPVYDSWAKYFLSHNNTIYKKDFLIKHPIPNEEYAEDLAMGKFIIENGFSKIYDHRCVIKHSHNYSFKEYFDVEKQNYTARSKHTQYNPTLNLKNKNLILFKQNISLIKKVFGLVQIGCFYLIKIIALLKIKILNK